MTTDEREMAKASWWELVEHTDTRALYALTRTGGKITSVCDLNLLAEGVVRDEQGSIREDWTQYVYYLSKTQVPWARDQPWRTLDRARKPARFTPLRLAFRPPRKGMVPLPRLSCRYCGQKALHAANGPGGYANAPVTCHLCGHSWASGWVKEYDWAIERINREELVARGLGYLLEPE